MKVSKKSNLSGATPVVMPYSMPLVTSFKGDYLKNKLQRGSLEIKSKNDLSKLDIAKGEKIDTLKLFFFNEHIGDVDIKHIAKRIKGLSSIEQIVADFGNYPRITDIGFSHFIDSVSDFPIKSLTISLGTSEICASTNITDEIVKRTCRMLRKSKGTMKEVELNLKK
jgi:hypothetical protein